MRKGVVVIALTVLPLVPLSPAAASDEPVLFGTVGPGFTIDLKDAKGEPVVTLTPGRYHLIVHVLSSERNFVMADEPAGRKEGVRHRPPVDEPEVRDRPLERRWHAPHPADEVVLERMVARVGEDVQAEHGLEQRRDGEADVGRVAVVEPEADHAL
jgi:hypothetical protein